MNVPDEGTASQIGRYDVKGQVHLLGPIVWTPVAEDAEGVRRTDFEGAEPTALPQELTGHQTNLLVMGVLTGVLEEYVVPELRKQLKLPTSLKQVLSSPELLQQALVIISPQGGHIVHMNEEAAQAEIPPGHGWVRVKREGFVWQVEADWLPQFPKPIIEEVSAVVMQLAEAIVKGDEEKAKDLARLWFPGLWDEQPRSLREQMDREVFVLLLGVRKRVLKDMSSRINPLEAIAMQFPQAMEALRRDYSLETIKAEAEERRGMSGIWLKETLADMERLFARSRLSDLELRIVRLEAALSERNEHWPSEDKEKFLRMRQGTFRAVLHRARTKLRVAARGYRDPHKKLLDAIFGRSGGKVS